MTIRELRGTSAIRCEKRGKRRGTSSPVGHISNTHASASMAIATGRNRKDKKEREEKAGEVKQSQFEH